MHHILMMREIKGEKQRDKRRNGKKRGKKKEIGEERKREVVKEKGIETRGTEEDIKREKGGGGRESIIKREIEMRV